MIAIDAPKTSAQNTLRYDFCACFLQIGLGASVFNYDVVCGLGSRGKVKERGGGGDVVTSLTTSDAEIARDPRPPCGWRRGGPVCFVAPPRRCAPASPASSLRASRTPHSPKSVPPDRLPSLSLRLWPPYISIGSLWISRTCRSVRNEILGLPRNLWVNCHKETRG